MRKNTMNKTIYFLFFVLNFIFSQNESGYVFKATTNDYYIDIENVVENHFGPWDILVNFSGRNTRKFLGVDEKTQNLKFINGWEKVVASMRMDEKVKPIHQIQKMNGASYTEIYSAEGDYISRTPNNDRSREVDEEIFSNVMADMIGAQNINLFFPLGDDSIRYIGDIWSSEEEKILKYLSGYDEFEGMQKAKSIFTFKQIKEKKGDKIAYLNQKSEIQIQGIGSLNSDNIEINTTLTGNAKIQFNLDKGIIKRCKQSLSSVGVSKNLSSNKEEKHTMNMSIQIKTKLK